jgi:tetratricopeptide (TPR) repeat protein
MKIKISFLVVILVVISGCSSFKPEAVLEKYLTAKSPSQRFRWITSESQNRFGKDSFIKYYQKYIPTEKILEIRRFATASPSHIRLCVRQKDSEGIETVFYTLKRDKIRFYRVCWNNILFNEAVGYFGNERWEEARALLKEAVQLDPFDDSAWRLMGQININTDRREEAWKNLQKAMELNPNDSEAFLAASEYWGKEDAEKSKRYTLQGSEIAEANFDNAPSSDYYVLCLLDAFRVSKSQESLLQKRSLLRDNLVHYSSSTAAMVCGDVLYALYESSLRSEKMDLHKDLDDWLKISTEKYGNDPYVQKTVSAIQAGE